MKYAVSDAHAGFPSCQLFAQLHQRQLVALVQLLHEGWAAAQAFMEIFMEMLKHKSDVTRVLSEELGQRTCTLGRFR